MGNQLDRITHLNYSELPTGDPSGIEKDELRVGVAYFFSDDEEDLDERGQPDKFGVKAPPGCTPCPESPSRHHHHLLHQLVLNETQFSAFRGQECIFSKVSGGPQGADLSVYAVTALPALCEPGDLLELLWLQPAPEPPAPAPHWASRARRSAGRTRRASPPGAALASGSSRREGRCRQARSPRSSSTISRCTWERTRSTPPGFTAWKTSSARSAVSTPAAACECSRSSPTSWTTRSSRLGAAGPSASPAPRSLPFPAPGLRSQRFSTSAPPRHARPPPVARARAAPPHPQASGRKSQELPQGRKGAAASAWLTATAVVTVLGDPACAFPLRCKPGTGKGLRGERTWPSPRVHGQ
uniref:Isoform 2 of Protein LRATD1 n=1 Tax=Homo sapiens TaxID=9606 RepID=Q96KN4-2|nr:unnamed protein product [Homo sapiens]